MRKKSMFFFVFFSVKPNIYSTKPIKRLLIWESKNNKKQNKKQKKMEKIDAHQTKKREHKEKRFERVPTSFV